MAETTQKSDAARYREFLDNMREKYGMNYLEKMSVIEQEMYITMFSSLYAVEKEEVRKKFSSPKEQMEITTLEELASTLQEEGYVILGHGTSGNNVDAVNKIFESGLRASHTSIFYTTMGLDVSNLEQLKGKLDHWEHRDSENIILMKLPVAYFNLYGESLDLECEKTGAFVNEVMKEDGKIEYFLDPKFILGAYNRVVGKIFINSKFEKKYSAETLKEMEEKLQRAQKKTQKRLEKQDVSLPEVAPSVPQESAKVEEPNWDEWNWDDGDFGELEPSGLKM